MAIDGYVTLPQSARTDAIILELRAYREPDLDMRMAVPYRPHHHPAGFAIYRPKFIVATMDGHDAAALNRAFFIGVFSHEYGGRIWRECSDQSW